MSSWERALQTGIGGGNLGSSVISASRRPAPRAPVVTSAPRPTQQPARKPSNFSSNMSQISYGGLQNVTPQDYSAAGRSAFNFIRAIPGALHSAAFGPERASSGTLGIGPASIQSIGSTGEDADLWERFARDQIFGEQERNLGRAARQQGRIPQAAGWYGMSLLPFTPFVRGVGRSVAAAGDVATAASRTPARVVSESFPTGQIDDILNRTPFQAQAPRVGTVESQIYQTPSGPINFSSPMDTSVRRPLQGSGVRFQSRNPFELQSQNPFGVGADDLMAQYMGAVDAARKAGLPTTDIDALMFLASRGDREASRLVSGISQASESPGMLRTQASPDLDDIVLVHSRRQGPVRTDRSGTGMLYAGGDFRSNPAITQGPNAFVPWRSTLHFTQNSRVADAPLAGSWSGNNNYVMARLNDVIEANPGSLGNLNPSDTYFTPRLNSPLLLPNARNIEIPSAPSGFHAKTWEPYPEPSWDGSLGRYRENMNQQYEDMVDEILGNNAREIGGEWLGARAIDTSYRPGSLGDLQSQAVRNYARQTGTPTAGHMRGTIPGEIESSALERAYRSGLGLEDEFFGSAIRNSRNYKDNYLYPFKSSEPFAPQNALNESPEFYRRLLTQGWLSGANPVRLRVADFDL